MSQYYTFTSCYGTQAVRSWLEGYSRRLGSPNW